MAPNVYVISVICLMLAYASTTLGSKKHKEYTGTTKALKKIFVGRCRDYLKNYAFINDWPEMTDGFRTWKFCSARWKEFTGAFGHKDICEVTPEDYLPFLKGSGENEIENKALFSSSHLQLSEEIAQHGERAVLFKNTFAGFVLDGLTWCGQTPDSIHKPNRDGINFHECPVCPQGKMHPQEVFNSIAYKMFAERAVGIVRIIVDGAEDPAFDHKNSIFERFVLPNLKPENVDEFRIDVVVMPGQTPVEGCGTGSIKELQEDLNKQLGKEPICVENPALAMELYCSLEEIAEEAAKHPECKRFYPTF